MMKILRSEAVDKSPGVFFDPEYDFKGPGTLGAIKQAKKRIFQKIPKFPKNCKKYKNIPFWGPLKRAPPGVPCPGAFWSMGPLDSGPFRPMGPLDPGPFGPARRVSQGPF